MDEEGEPSAAATFSRASAEVDPEVSHPPPSRDAPPGLALVADLAAPGVLAEALKSVREVGVDLIDALMASADVDADAVIHRLARRMGLAALVAGDPLPPSPSLPAHEAAAALRSGLLRLADGRTVVAARGTALRRLVAGLHAPVGRDRVLLATPRRFVDLVMAESGKALVLTCRDLLERQAPHLSARPLVVTRSAAVALATLVGLPIAVLWYAPPLGHAAVSLFFLLVAGIRLMAALRTILPSPPAPVPPPIAAELPIYSVVVPLYRESRALAGLLDALAALDYPAAKLDIKLVVEGDDAETEAALARHRLPGHVEVLRLPPGRPRTKPRALNVALAAARGSHLVIYDAEDRPDPNQLRMALAAFAAGPPALACVQAALTIDNSRDAWLTRLFTIEYAALFDAFLPSLAALGLPFPLGGSSNHFRVSALREAGAWDPWNVTEDADLGLRLARRGCTMITIPSSTFEEAPNRLGPWMRQRTRWMKGYSLTWWIHTCRPRRLLAELGVVRFVALNAIVAGVPLSAMTLPVLLADLIWRLPHMLAGRTWAMEAPLAYVDAANLVFGFGATAWLAIVGIRRRRLRGYLGYVCWLPVYWLLSSVAAYRALFQLAAAPHLWEKTEHGLARTSRRRGSANSE